MDEERHVPKVAHFSVPGSGVVFEVSRTQLTASQSLKRLPDAVESIGDLEMRTSVLGSVSSSMKMMELLSGKTKSSLPEMFVSDEALEEFRFNLLLIAMGNMDASATQLLWQGIRHARTTMEQLSFGYTDEAVTFFSNLTDTGFEELLRMIVCKCRKPRLATALLRRQFLGKFPNVLAKNMVALAMAIGDAVFNSDTNRSQSWQDNHDAWLFRFVTTVPQPTPEHPCCKDYTCDLMAWKDLVGELLCRSSHVIPERLLVQYHTGPVQTVTMLELAMNFSVHDTYLLDTLIDNRLFSFEPIEEAFSNLVTKKGVVLGSNLQHVLASVYKIALDVWRRDARSQPTVQCGDPLALLWSRLVLYSSGYDELEMNEEATILVPDETQTRSDVDPSDWMAAIQAMILVHAPNPDDSTSSTWDYTSPLFSSILVMALKSAVGAETKTHLVVYLLQQWLEHNNDSSLTSLFHKDPGSGSDLVKTIAKLHLDAFPILVEILLTKTIGTEQCRINVQTFRYTLGLVVNDAMREAARMIVRALTPHGLYDGKQSNLLVRWVETLGKAVSTRQRNKFGSTVCSLLNKEIEMDFVELLQSSEWAQEDKTAALVKAVECKHSIPAQVLSKPPHNLQLPEKHDPSPWLQAITEFLFQPTSVTVAGIVSGLEQRAETLDGMKRDAPFEEDDDELEAKRRRVE